MAVIEGGTSTTQAEVGIANGDAALFNNAKPVPFGALGHYRLAAVTGTMAAALAAAAQFFTFRWTDATRLCIIQEVNVTFLPLTLFTAASLSDFGWDMFKATAVSAGGGGTALTSFTKMRPTMGASLLGATDVRISTTAALTALTTLDTNAIAMGIGARQRVNPAAATEEQLNPLPYLNFKPDQGAGQYPLVLGQNEGFVLRNRVVWPAAGTGVLKVEMSWCEVANY